MENDLMMKTKCSIRILLVLLGLILSHPLVRGENLSTAANLADGLAAIAREDSNPVYSICVIKEGATETRYIQPSSRCHNCYSIAKLFTVTAIGILEDRGFLSTNENVYPIFQDQFPEGFDPKWKDVRVCDVLSQKIGFENGFLDIDVEEMRSWKNNDFLNLVLSHPIKYSPGTKYVYSDAAFYLASRIVTEKTGEKLDDFLIREIANPLNFSEFAFSKCPMGYPMGATGLYLSTEDVAKLGTLYIQNGEWEGNQLLSEKFVKKAFDNQFELYRMSGFEDAFYKGGMNGQLLYMNRKTGTSCAIHSFRSDLDKLKKFLAEHDF